MKNLNPDGSKLLIVVKVFGEGLERGLFILELCQEEACYRGQINN